MMRRRIRAGFTLIELLVVVAIIALLISILLPGLQGARDQGKKAVCGSNLAGLGRALYSYATEDTKELIIPVHRYNVNNPGPFWGGGGQWMWRTVLPGLWGGRTATTPFPTGSGSPQTTLTNDVLPFAARTKPLNKYVLGAISQSDSKKMEMYHCPSDVGYPDDPRIRDNTTAAAKIPMYDLVGNSYRANMGGMVQAESNGPNYYGGYTVGPYAHRLSTLSSMSDLLMVSDPLVYEMFPINLASPENRRARLFMGWHKKIGADNALFADGHTQQFRVSDANEFDSDTLTQMGLPPGGMTTLNAGYLRRSERHRIDCYPTPAARIRQQQNPDNPARNDPGFGNWSYWPLKNYQDNFN
ncbi:MAG: prepilin-type N-terminal cleavage/methylation domain-containing protein [Phycisphaerales bacterium]|nr:prepilin-type N-terminal cleavage/methylation domain-containing protein [Phycisphaerales bacterium]